MQVMIGYKGENAARQTSFDIGKYLQAWPDSVVTLEYKAPNETETRVVTGAILDGSTLRWTPTAADLSQAGTGLVQLVFTGADGALRGKSPVMYVTIGASI